MHVHALWSPPQPDLSDEVVHLTGRCGEHRSDLPADIQAMTAQQRLASILHDQQIRAFPPFNINIDDPAVCFSEATLEGLRYLVDAPQPRYEPYGIAFAKQTVFEQGGGPAFYVRGDEWPLVEKLPVQLRGRATRFWPGAEPDPGEDPLLPWLQGSSLWTHERQWRIVGVEMFDFRWDQIAYVLVPDQVSWQRITDSLLEPLQDEARMLTTALGDQDPNALSAEGDVEQCAAALSRIPFRRPRS